MQDLLTLTGVSRSPFISVGKAYDTGIAKSSSKLTIPLKMKRRSR